MNNVSSLWKWIFATRPTAKVALLVALTLPNAAMAQSLKHIWRDSRVETYTTPAADELTSAKALIIDELRYRDGEKLSARWSQLGFTRDIVSLDERDFVVIRESEDSQTGRAFLVFTKDNGRLIIQTPHGRTDLHTGSITLRMMQEGGYTAGIWNVAPRRIKIDSETKKVDMGKLQDSYFVAFSKAVSEVHNGAAHLQMHGFSQAKRDTESAKGATIIVSAGTKVASDKAYKFAVCLEKFYPGDVRLYPQNVSELGGTRNISGATLRDAGASGFLHLELAKSLRETLRNSAKERARITGCLQSLF